MDRRHVAPVALALALALSMCLPLPAFAVAAVDTPARAAPAGPPLSKARVAELRTNLAQLVNYGAYQGSYLAWAEDYARAYRQLRGSDPATAAKYADKAATLLKSGLRDFQKADSVTRQFIARGDGATRTFRLPHERPWRNTIRVYLGGVWTKAVVRKNADGGEFDEVDYYSKFLKVSDAPDGPPNYAEGADWRHNPDLRMNRIDWSPAGREPAQGATYHVTQATSFAQPSVPFRLGADGRSVSLTSAPGTDKAVFVEYVYGPRYEQTSSGDGGFRSAFVDDGYVSRNLRHLPAAYDAVYERLDPALRAEAERLFVRWSDHFATSGYAADSGASNYGVGHYAFRAAAALALAHRKHPEGPRLVADVVKWRQEKLVRALTGPAPSLRGGWWAEGYGYGNLAARLVIAVGLDLERAGAIPAADAERAWAREVSDYLAAARPAPKITYDGGDWFAYPAPDPTPDLTPALQAAGAPDPAKLKPPLAYRAEGVGLVLARERAAAPDAGTFVSFLCGGLVNADHQQYSPGQLQINRGADHLLVNAPLVGRDQSGCRKSENANVVQVDDGGEGAQVYRRAMGVWYAQLDPATGAGVGLTAFRATDAHVYAAGTYGAAYSLNTAPNAGGPVRSLARQVVYLRGANTVIVRDQVETTKPAYAKQLQWHTLDAPAVGEDGAWSAAAGGSELRGRTFATVPAVTAAAAVKVGNAVVHRVATNPADPVAAVRYVTAFQVGPRGFAALPVRCTLEAAADVLSVGGATVTFAGGDVMVAGAQALPRGQSDVTTPGARNQRHPGLNDQGATAPPATPGRRPPAAAGP